MGKSKIAWTEMVWNPVTGCTQISPGCAHCYARRMAETRLRGRAGYPADEPFRPTLHPERLTEPTRWHDGRRVFVVSMGDLFHPDVPFEFITRVFNTIWATPRHTYLLLTKRPERMKEFTLAWYQQGTGRDPRRDLDFMGHVWVGTSAEDQKRADERIPLLLQTPAAVHFVSAEPLLGPLNLSRWLEERSGNELWAASFNRFAGLDWVIVGGESGPDHRPMDLDWARAIRDQCVAARVPLFYKQGSGVRSGMDPTLDGREWREYPDVGR